jgi:radical SAM protein with 4Fe4S-binding SPASM domain
MKEGDGEGLTRERIRDLWDHRLGCGGGWSALGIAPDGNAFLCEQMKMAEPFYVGNAAEQSIAEIWKGERLRRFIYPEREAFVGKVCEHCGEFEKCMWEKGRCYRDAYFSFGSIYEQPPLCPYNPRLGLRAS